jgi:hypothetical protein
MKQMKKNIGLGLLILLLGCVEPVPITTPEDLGFIVIEGYITDATGPHEITVSRTSKYGSVFEGRIEVINNATVAIRDSQGQTTFLNQIAEDGKYYTPATFKGEQGETYTLQVTTLTGESYTSLPETIPTGTEIEEVELLFVEKSGENAIVDVTGVEAYAKWNDPGNEQNFTMWKTQGIYFIKTFPENFVQPGVGLAPKACCAECYVYETNVSGGIQLHSDQNQNGQEVIQLAGFIVDDGARFNAPYTLRVEQLSLSGDAYQFYNLIKTQSEISGSIFDPPPAEITGNIINLNDPNIPSLGYFGAFHSSSMIVSIDPSIITNKKPPAIVNDDCQVIPGSSLSPPSPWE